MQAIRIKHDVSGSGYSEIYRGEYPNNDPNQVVIFLPPYTDYEWLHYNEVKNYPNDYDSRIWIEERTEGPTNIKHPIYTNINQWRIEWSLIKRTNDEIINAVREAEAQANSTLLLESERDKMYTLHAAALARKQDGITLSEFEQNVLNRMTEIAVKVTQNAQIAENKIELINNGQEPDIDSDWQTDDIVTTGFPFSE